MTQSALIALLVALGGLLPLGAMAQEAEATTDAPAEATVEATEEAAPAEVAVPDMVLGAEDAPVTMIEYASFTCPHCAAFHADQFQQLKTDYIDTGKVRFILREVYFDRFGLWASMVARCGGEMRFYGIADMLYEDQQGWIGDGQPATIADNLRRIGRTAGLDDATLEACLADEGQAQALLAWYEENAATDGIRATPTLMIDGQSHGNMSYEELSGVIDAALAE
jgi:protein-disulfide isomerase